MLNVKLLNVKTHKPLAQNYRSNCKR